MNRSVHILKKTREIDATYKPLTLKNHHNYWIFLHSKQVVAPECAKVYKRMARKINSANASFAIW